MDTTFATPQPNSPPIWNETISGRGVSPKAAVAQVRTLDGEYTVDFAQPTAQPSSWTVSAFKRFLDVFVAATALLISWPLLLLTAIVVRLESDGPVIFCQRRVGQHGALFTVYKFRTMEAATHEDGPSVTKLGDPRITRFGAFLRKHKLDELPQLINVLRGEMSLIGPRPRLPHHMEVQNLPFRPGLTGAATLAFRCEEEMLQGIPDHELEAYNLSTIIPLKWKLDSDYMAQATIKTDVALLFETAACCLSARPNTFMIDFS